MNAKCFILAFFLGLSFSVGAEVIVVGGATLPPVSLGDTCTYQVTEYGISRTEEETVVRTHPDEGYLTAFSRNGVRIGTPRYSVDGVRASAPILRYPMKVGAEWEVEYSSKLATGTITTRMKGRVTDIRGETIQGRVLQLVSMSFTGSYTERYTSEGTYGGTIAHDLVYAPEIRCVVRSQRTATSVVGPFKIEVTLQSYKNAGQNP